MSKLNMYGYYFMNLITRGLRMRKGEISADGIVTKYDSVLTRNYTRKILAVREFTTLDIGNPMARIFRSELIKKFKGIKVFIHLDCKSNQLDIKDLTYLRRYKRAEDMFNQYSYEIENMSGSEKVTGKVYRGRKGEKIKVTEADLRKYRNIFRSYEYVTETIMQGGQFFDTGYFVEILIPDIYDPKMVMEEAINICDIAGLSCEVIESKTSKFLANKSLTAVDNTTKEFPKMLFSSEDIAMNSSYMSPGLVGGYGILHGIDKFSGLPLLINYFNSGGAKVGLILAESGAGKTFQAFMMCLQFIAEGIHCSVIDIKGAEWIKLKRLGVKTVVIKLNNTVSSFVNLLRLDDLVTSKTKTEDLLEYYNLAVTGTIKLLSAMVDIRPEEGHPLDVELILREAVSKVFNSCCTGFSKTNADSFKTTSNLTYMKVIEQVRKFGEEAVSDIKDRAHYDERRADLCRLIDKRCTPFLDSASDSYLLKNEITLKEILNAELVIYEMDKNQDTQASIADTVRVIMAQFLDVKKHHIRKQQGLQTVAFYEELQRCGDMKTLMDFITAMVTGGRSNNLAVFLLLNAISTFDNDAFSAIKSNITLYLIGKIKSGDIATLCNDFDCGDLAEYLYCINPEADKDSPKEVKARRLQEDFSKCFAIKFRTDESRYDKTIYKLELPERVIKVLETVDRKADRRVRKSKKQAI